MHPKDPESPVSVREHAERRTAQFEVVRDSVEDCNRFDGEATSVTPRRRSTDPGPEANITQIAHPKGLGLGRRYRYYESYGAYEQERAGSAA